MDYRYLKEEIENEKNLKRKKFEEEYQNQEAELVEIICKQIIDQIKGAVKSYYYNSLEGTQPMYMHSIKKPTLFRRNWLYEEKLRNIIFRVVKTGSSNTQVYGSINFYDSDIACAWIPEKKFEKFNILLNQRLKREKIRIQFLDSDFYGGYELKITADLGKL